MVRGLGCRVQWQRLHGAAFHEFVSRWGISVRYRAAHAPFGNGVSERNHRSVKTIVARKGCSVAEAVYRYNVMPRSDDLNSSPANELFNYKLRVPDVESEEKCEESIPADNSWEPCPEEIELLKYHTDRRKVTSNSTIGLRGMINLGNTCFMSTILQALTHTPMLRDYFLGDKHLCLAPDPDRCLACQINSLFQQLYGGQRTALAPTRLLHMIWTSAKHLAGYEQQDAHEFFMAILDLLHQQMKPFQRDRTPQEGGGGGGGSAGCRCIIDTIFTGGLQSDVVCLSCKWVLSECGVNVWISNVSTTIDPFWDISLDLAPLELNQSTPTTLEDCLEQFTRQEHLGSSAKIKCVSCDSYQESTKQLTMKELPIVASFHLKRFEHTSRLRKKISTVVRFPEELDMTPYLSRCRNNNNFRQERVFNNNLYSLYAVVNHIGTLEAGHYIVYIRQHRDNWFKCDDHIITRATLRDVLNSEGYLLFYHKHRLEYSYE
ncbi:Ubiquitin carboxyl-terminal hydrolase 22 [Amphibalanus amphitrite]|uniref:ubiquitinyl hydrolase 1 n=1 Tax=Amphibalanus amphitrite TaxID=1232801 RepID=A0A6A4VAD6_AMPAM|nr:Ubiquitin carboxyl-terminal hydrolase 22 [Amphibalanus amphitrite]